MLTKKQKLFLDYITKFIEKNGYAPSFEEIKSHFKLASKSTVHQHINGLISKGFLSKEHYKARSIELSQNKQKNTVDIPLLGTIAAGEPIEAIETAETITVSTSQIAKTGEHFALRVAGNSMVGEGIFDNDIVIIKKQETAENGETVVALLNGDEVTLKKIYKEKNGFRLQPANSTLKPIFAKDVMVQGKVVSVLRNLEQQKENNIASQSQAASDFLFSMPLDLEKERKVKNRVLKEQFRGGTKNFNHSVEIKPNVQNFEKFVNKIICGDSKKVLSEMPDNCVDIIITSPPYNFGLDYKSDSKNDTKKWVDYFSQLSEIWRECARVLKPGGRFCVNVQPLFSDYIPTHHLISKQLLDLGLLWKGEILWEKNNYNCKYTAWGSWKSPSMPYLKYSWEFIEVFCKETHKKTGDSKNIDIVGDEFKKWVYAKWSIAPERNMKKYEHPAMFPEELAARLLKLFSYKNDFVLDPFNGAGTTTTIAKKLSRKFLGIDIAPEYCKTAELRLSETLF